MLASCPTPSFYTIAMSSALKIQRWLRNIKGRATAIAPGRRQAASWAALAVAHVHCEPAPLVSYIKKGFPAARKETLGNVPRAAAWKQQPEQSPRQLWGRQMLRAGGAGASVGAAWAQGLRPWPRARGRAPCARRGGTCKELRGPGLWTESGGRAGSCL